MMRLVIYFILCLVLPDFIYAQGCCSGGSGSPIAGGVSNGVLQEGQFELGLNYQYSNSNKVYMGDKLDTVTSNEIQTLSSKYLYSRIAYGVSKKLTVSVEAGYYLDRSLVKKHPENIDNHQQSSGFSDLIIFPKYDIYDKTTEKSHTEITIGLGMKLPIGTCMDSTVVYVDPMSAQKSYTISAPTVQPSTGSQDFIYYAFVFKEFKKSRFRIFANGLYVKKGWNKLGEKFGDYAGIGLFAGKTFFKRLGVTLQLKGEWIAPMQAAPGIDVLALYNVDIASTGSKKFSFVPQINYSYKSFTVFIMDDIPFYQYQRGTQIGSQYLVVTGISYRFIPNTSGWKVSQIK